MIIVADQNIPLVREAFSHLGTVRSVPGRAITNESLRDAECLLVRSVTKVDRALLDGTPVRFVATATSGFDHVDTAYLEAAGIEFAYAPGSNALSVAEWVVAALLHYAVHARVTLAGKTIGIIGVGQVGGEVLRLTTALGLRAILNDPPLREQTGDERYRPLGEALAADFVTLHAPLTRDVPHATWHLADARFFADMKPGAVFINAARGAVTDTAAIKSALSSGRVAAAMLDVWEGEPQVDVDLLAMAHLATPHIAGYSYDGKVLGAEMIYRAACKHLRTAPTFDWSAVLPPPDRPAISPRQSGSLEEALTSVVRVAYDIGADDARFRRTLTVPEAEQGTYFSQLRREYPVRREFRLHAVTGTGADPRVLEILRELGFGVSDS